MVNIHEWDHLTKAEQHAALDKLKRERKLAYDNRKKGNLAIKEGFKQLRNRLFKRDIAHIIEEPKQTKE